MNPLEGMTIVIEQEDEALSAKTNKENRENTILYWGYGPEETTSDNTEFWRKMAKAWGVSPPEARRQLCSNCTYFDNSPEALEMAESIPEDEYDDDGNGRGYCMKHSFICHNLRVCQSWESREQEED
jgi:hypothetical protein